ncbi:MAG TPA: phage tail protein [Symbiobacteriaceae bacterium]|jgi:phage tail-like protein|nr:phage tail protein [Symbiobacteriaceae bacterium]
MPDRPLATFQFELDVTLWDGTTWTADFSECDGLEMSMEPLNIREGGNNGQQIHLPGPVSYGTAVLKRGLTTAETRLWQWFEQTIAQPSTQKKRVASNVVIKVLPTNGDASQAVSFNLVNAMPVRIKAPTLNGVENKVAIEEIQLAYEYFYRTGTTS